MTNRLFALSLVVTLLATSNAMAQIKWLNFTGWNHSQVSGAGQTFLDIFEDADVAATVEGDFTLPTLGTVSGIVSQNRVVGQQTFQFTFTKQLDLVVQAQTVDSQERFRIASDTTKNYVHEYGAAPVVSLIGDTLQLAGVSTRISPTGASRGLVYLGKTDSLAVTHEALVPNKYERFRIGVLTSPVPEPATGVTAMFAVAMLGLARRHKAGSGR